MASRSVLSILILLFASMTTESGATEEQVVLECVGALHRIESLRAAWRLGGDAPERVLEPATLRPRVLRERAAIALVEARWREQVGVVAVEAELLRMARDTHHPSRLRALFRALDDDPRLVAECLVRPLLAEREGLRRMGEEGVEAWRDALAELDPSLAPSPLLGLDALALPEIDESPCIDDTWRPIAPAPLGARSKHSAVWSGAEMIIYGGSGSHGEDHGARYDPATDAWSLVSSEGAPGWPYNHTAVWTGEEMIVWGGCCGASGGRSSGGRYDPATDTWTPTRDDASTPLGRDWHSAVWSGHEMIIWGGHGQRFMDDNLRDGGRYDPATDSWLPLSEDLGARDRHGAVWGAERMIVWGGNARLPDGLLVYLSNGSRYDPAHDEWARTSAEGSPGARTSYVAAWAEPEMIIWGGHGPGGATSTGARYDPRADLWRSLPADGSEPPPRLYSAGVWNGSDLLVWGGYQGSDYVDTGGRYLRANDSWRATSIEASTPSGREYHTAIWTGREMIVWGGWGEGGALADGAAYCALCTWYPDADKDGYGESDAPLLDECVLQEGYQERAGDCDDGDAEVNPDALDVCDGVDNDCDGGIDNHVPGWVEGLLLEHAADVTALSWMVVPAAEAYDVARGDLLGLRDEAGGLGHSLERCAAEDLAETFMEDVETPPSGGGAWFLVRAVNCAGVGSYDASEAGDEGRDAELDGHPRGCL